MAIGAPFATRIATRVVDEKSPREPGTVRCAVIVQLEMLASVFYTTSANSCRSVSP